MAFVDRKMGRLLLAREVSLEIVAVDMGGGMFPPTFLSGFDERIC